MARQTRAEKASDQFDVSGFCNRDFVASLFRTLPTAKALSLTKDFAWVSDRNYREAEEHGKSYEAGLHRDMGAEVHKEMSTAPTRRDNEYADLLPRRLRAAFFHATKDNKEFAYNSGKRQIEHKRTMDRLDILLSTAEGRAVFYGNTADNAHLRDPIMFPR